MMNTVEATYKAATPEKHSRIEIETKDLPMELNQMIVWIMCNPEKSAALLPVYRELREQAEATPQT